jgi:energy-coupling factor transport system permease protein
MFIIATNPSEFAASLNSIGISYYVGYSVAIALRYIPDVQDDYAKIRNAQEARGIEMSKKAGIGKRIRRVSAIIFPLIFTSMDRIDVVSNAMELRGFGKYKKRTWYSGKAFEKNDYLVLAFTVIFCTAALIITFRNGSRFYNPFV